MIKISYERHIDIVSSKNDDDGDDSIDGNDE